MPYNIDIKQSRLTFQPMIGGNNGDVVVVPWKFDRRVQKGLVSYGNY